jgi:hypothetical protein
MKPRLLLALSSIVISSLLVLALASGAFAYGHDYDHGHGWGREHGKGRHHHYHASELDPALISNGLTLLAGSALLLMERKRRRS